MRIIYKSLRDEHLCVTNCSRNARGNSLTPPTYITYFITSEYHEFHRKFYQKLLAKIAAWLLLPTLPHVTYNLNITHPVTKSSTDCPRK